jgi:hypothetical protein
MGVGAASGGTLVEPLSNGPVESTVFALESDEFVEDVEPVLLLVEEDLCRRSPEGDERRE